MGAFRLGGEGVTLLYPERVRCLGCRRYFAFEVVLRQYCSRECAGLDPRPTVVAEWPRTCRVWNHKDRVWVPKRSFPVESEARDEAALHDNYFYECPNCFDWHISKSPEPYEGN